MVIGGMDAQEMEICVSFSNVVFDQVIGGNVFLEIRGIKRLVPSTF
jgi:hypothetical protein